MSQPDAVVVHRRQFDGPWKVDHVGRNRNGPIFRVEIGDWGNACDMSTARIAHSICDDIAQIILTAHRCAVGDDTNAAVCRGAVSPRTHRRPLYEPTPLRFNTKVKCARGICRNRESSKSTSIIAGGSFGFAFSRSVIPRSMAS